jgi:hypothetical protein
MAQNNWIATGFGSFTAAADWSLGTVPTFSDDAFIGTNGAIVASTINETVNSIGTGTNGDVLLINSGSIFTVANGTGPNANSGTIEVDDGSLLDLASGTFFNPGTLRLNSVNNATKLEASVALVPATVTFDGGGKVEMSTGLNVITGANVNAQINNKNNDFAGSAIIDAVFFDNQTNGVLETNSSLGTGVLSITGVGGFQNEGHMFADDGGTLLLGSDGLSEHIFNFGLMEALGNTTTTKIEIAGNLTISGDGRISLDGNNPSLDEIVSDGKAATLTLDGVTLDGGAKATIGDVNLTLNINSGSLVIADKGIGDVLFFNSPHINNAGTIEATNNGRLSFGFGVSVNNTGTIVVQHGELDVGSTIFDSGIIEIGDGLMDVTGFSTVTNNVVFTGGQTRIIVGKPNGLQGSIIGAGAGLILDDGADAFGNLHVTWQQNGSTGKLSLVDNTTGNILTSFNLVGQYDQSDFSAASDGGTGTQINITNPSPPAGTTAALTLRNFNTGVYEIYDIGGNAILATHPLGEVGLNFGFAGLGHFFGNDTSDMILRNTAGAFEVYDISNNNITGAAPLGAVGTNFLVQGFGDFSSKPNETDMLLRDDTTGQFEVYDIANNQITFPANIGTVGLDWQIGGNDGFGNTSSIGNFSSKGEADMILRSSSTGKLELYDIANNQITPIGVIGTVGTDWFIVGTGNFSSNPGESDLMMRQGGTGKFEVYDIANNQITNHVALGAVGLEWQVEGFGPISGVPGESDMLLRNSNTGALEVYDIRNNQIIPPAVNMGSVGLEWQPGGVTADPPASDSNAQLVQAMAGFGGGSGAAISNTAPLGAETSQQPLLTTPQHA